MDKFDQDLKEIKDNLQKYTLSEEFKSELKEKMDQEYKKITEEREKRKIQFSPQRFVAAFACFIFVFSGCITFADEFESWVQKIFSNTDKVVEKAIANGNYEKIDMDYVENNGVSIKVDYIVKEKDALYIAFNVKTEEEYDNIYFENMKIKNNNNEIIFDTINKKEQFRRYTMRIDNKKYIVSYKILSGKLVESEFKNFEIENIEIQNNNNKEIMNENWNLY